MTPELRHQWSQEAPRQLQGRTIKAAEYVPDEEFGSLLALELDDGTVAFVMEDDEGNGPGALHLQKGREVTYSRACGEVTRPPVGATVHVHHGGL